MPIMFAVLSLAGTALFSHSAAACSWPLVDWACCSCSSSFSGGNPVKIGGGCITDFASATATCATMGATLSQAPYVQWNNTQCPGSCGGASAPAGRIDVTIYNRTNYKVFFNIRCGNSSWTAYAMEPTYHNNYWCSGTTDMRISFKKSWLNGCANQEQEYKVTAGDNHFQPTGCGMDLYTGNGG